eukprot:gene11227-13092_t
MSLDGILEITERVQTWQQFVEFKRDRDIGGDATRTLPTCTWTPEEHNREYDVFQDGYYVDKAVMAISQIFRVGSVPLTYPQLANDYQNDYTLETTQAYINSLRQRKATVVNLTGFQHLRACDLLALDREYLAALVTLDLTNCTNGLLANIAAPLALKCTSLETLSLSGTKVEHVAALYADNVNIIFTKLSTLLLNNCANLETVRVHSPVLQTLYTDDCPLLVYISAPVQQTLSIRQCPRIPLSLITKLFEQHTCAVIMDRQVGDSLYDLLYPKHLDMFKREETDTISITDRLTDIQAKVLSLSPYREMFLIGCKIPHLGIQSLGRHPTLTSLHLYNNIVSPQDIQALASSQTITQLDLSHNAIQHAAIAYLATNTTITSLSIIDNQLRSKSVAQLATNNHIKRLVLAENFTKDKGLLSFCNNTSIDYLNLCSNKLISADGCLHLSKHTSLTTLLLNDNNINDFGAINIAQSPSITTLHLDNNYIGDSGAQHLAQNKVLTNLSLNKNKITDKGATFFLQNQTIKILHITHNRISVNVLQSVLENLIK